MGGAEVAEPIVSMFEIPAFAGFDVCSSPWIGLIYGANWIGSTSIAQGSTCGG